MKNVGFRKIEERQVKKIGREENQIHILAQK